MRHLPLLCVLVPLAAVADDAPPRSLDPRIKVELFAEHPQIVTPTGIDVDHQGRVWAIESNTHFRPEGYQGHPSDRLLVLTDTTGDGRADRIVPFADGLTHAMSVAVRPVWLPAVAVEKSKGRKVEKSEDQAADRATVRLFDTSTLQVFVATREAVWLLEDTTGDLRADRRTRLVHLDTPGTYPHNGLAGFAFDWFGWMYFGFGENLGAKYQIIGSDGTTLSGGGEGGNLYRCRPDGTELSLWATGFWNPHASCVNAFGGLFTVDNDPDSRPPCRLLHIVGGGDYGYRFRNGRRGLHPFTSWNGEIPGTLPMVAGTGEAPSGIVAYESDGLPEEYLGNLLVTSWGDHRIDRFRLERKGASFTSRAEPLITGGQNFRPVGLATAPDGSLYCTDWVLRDYKLHGQGRVWRISGLNESERTPLDASLISSGSQPERLGQHLSSRRLEVRRKAADALSRSESGRRIVLGLLRDPQAPPRMQLESLWALSRLPISEARVGFLSNQPNAPSISPNNLEVRIAVVRQLDSPQFPYQPQGKSFLLDDDLHRQLFGDSDTGAGLSNLNRWQVAIAPLLQFSELRGLIPTQLREEDPYRLAAVVGRLSDVMPTDLWPAHYFGEVADAYHGMNAENRRWEEFYSTATLLATRSRAPRNRQAAAAALALPFPSVRRLAVQWVAEEGLKDLRPQVEQVLDSESLTPDLLMATLAALSMLDGVPPAEFEKSPPSEYLLPIVRDRRRPPALRATVLRTLPAEAQELDAALLGELVGSDDRELRLEAVRTLQQARFPGREDLLRPIVADERQDTQLRAEAVVALADGDPGRPLSDATVQLLRELIGGEHKALRAEAMRTVRSVIAEQPEKRDEFSRLFKQSEQQQSPDARETNAQVDLLFGRTVTWKATDIPDGGDPEAGRRIFFHPHSAGCFKCHTVHGRGGKVGPDLSVVARSLDRKKLAESVLEPGREISPQYVGWTFVMKSGQVHTGLVVGEGPGDRIQIGRSDGTVLSVNRDDVEEWQPSRTSIMPDKLHERLTPGEFRDLLAYLETLK